MVGLLTKKQVYIPLLIVFAVALIYWKVKKRTTDNTKKLTSEIPDDDSSTELTEYEKEQASDMADKLYKEIDGLGRWDVDIATEFAGYSDRMTVAVSNYFNERYYEQRHDTLYEWMSAEYFGWFNNKAGRVVEEIILPKFIRLGLNK